MNSIHDLYFGRLRVILAGQRSFGKAVFELLRKRGGVEIAAVYAPPGDVLTDWAAFHGALVRPAGTLRSGSMPENCDLIVAAHSHDFISKAVRNRLRLGAIGYHPSLLPRHRGRDAIKWAVRCGDPVTGGTVFWLSDTVDGGPIAAQDWCWIRPDDTASELWKRDLFPMGLRLLDKVLSDILQGRLVMADQDHALATWEPALTDAPRLYRPELLQLGNLPPGYQIEK